MRSRAAVFVIASLLAACTYWRSDVRSGVVPGIELRQLRRVRIVGCDGAVGERLGYGLNRRGFQVMAGENETGPANVDVRVRCFRWPSDGPWHPPQQVFLQFEEADGDAVVATGESIGVGYPDTVEERIDDILDDLYGPPP